MFQYSRGLINESCVRLEQSVMTKLFFVYGSLKAGQANHHLLVACKFADVGYVPGCALADLGSFPGMIPAQCESSDWAEGEIYESADLQETLAYLDALEHEGSLYKRVIMPIVKVVEGKREEVLCWTYLYMPKYKARTLVEGGSW
jgi:gamma-glutamylcyclotransferase (GGCT)/AIG2-like uncharacterized protein YtfP